MKVWIHIDGVQEGPYELEQLPLDRMTPATPVWYEGLAQWALAGEAPLTAPLFTQANEPVESNDVEEAFVVEEDAPETEEPDESNRDENPAANNEPANSYYRNAQAAYQHQPADWPKCPPTYLVWSILLTIICCNPIGIVAIITGALVQSKYTSRNFEGAEKMCRLTQWWLMITIVTCLISLPFMLILNFA